MGSDQDFFSLGLENLNNEACTVSGLDYPYGEKSSLNLFVSVYAFMHHQFYLLFDIHDVTGRQPLRFPVTLSSLDLSVIPPFLPVGQVPQPVNTLVALPRP